VSHVPEQPAPALGRHLAVFGVQVCLVLGAVAVSRLDPGGMASVAAVMTVAAANAFLVAFALMGIGRESRLVSILVVMTLVIVVGLLVWPAWDVAGRARVF
jgi:caa(3)-type oxidase subunit IV